MCVSSVLSQDYLQLSLAPPKFKLTCLSCLLDVESVSDEEEVGVDEAHRLTDILLKPGAWVEAELDPALVPLMSNVVLQWSSDLALACKGTVDESIQERRFKPRHYIFLQNLL